MFLLFVNLCKAYDFVTREALCNGCALQKYGVPDVMIEVIQSLLSSEWFVSGQARSQGGSLGAEEPPF